MLASHSPTPASRNRYTAQLSNAFCTALAVLYSMSLRRILYSSDVRRANSVVASDVRRANNVVAI